MREEDPTPHCILEYSANVVDRPDAARLLKEIHDLSREPGCLPWLTSKAESSGTNNTESGAGAVKP